MIHEGILAPPWLPHSLKKLYPSLFSSFKMIPFLQQNTDFSAQNNLFCDKKLTFHLKMNPLFCGKTLTFQRKMNPPFHGKTLDIQINPFFAKFTEVSTKIPPFSRKMRILDFLKKTPLFVNFRTRMRVVK